ncbi:hypothetical protein [Sphingomonas solaris]|uniref:Uncharacterized protein n=1 Tax=Alterirhizorhabdus solaris TaxID=2529389 RepID=A0A558R6H7_9SPHN|nr:hypothetical protein [Sphingomonas solaris]TVV74986.1 hypothetical protein FOY91_08385 [Sphingomonas solaris]
MSFDYFRANSQTGELLEAWWSQRTRPTAAQVFSHIALYALNPIDGVDRSGWGRLDAVDGVRLVEHLSEAHRIAAEIALDPDAPYRDTHCWCFTPASFEAILYDLRVLGIVSLSIDTLTVPGGHEFFVRLVNDGGRSPLPDADEVRAERTRRQLAIVAYERN